jgi:hypothetical protein
VILTLTVLNTDTISITRSICAGDTFRIGNIAYTQSGNYSDTLTNGNGCDSIVTLMLTVNSLPVVTFTWDSLIAMHDVVNMINVSGQDYQVGNDTAGWCSWPAHFPSYFLLTGGSPPRGHYSGPHVSNDTLTPHLPDSIMYFYSDSYGCSQSAFGLLFETYCDGINQINANNSISIYPNPASTELFIKAENFKPVRLTLYDISGQVLQSGKFEPHIDISQLSSGVYFIEVKAGNEVARKRFVKIG